MFLRKKPLGLQKKTVIDAYMKSKVTIVWRGRVCGIMFNKEYLHNEISPHRKIQVDKIYKENLTEYPRLYTKIIIYCDHDIFLYDVLEKTVVHELISDKEIDEMKESALHNAKIFREK